jgi:hypothetical protein
MSELSIAKANSTAFKTFSNTHEDLGNALKVVSVGLSLTTEEIHALNRFAIGALVLGVALRWDLFRFL